MKKTTREAEAAATEPTPAAAATATEPTPAAAPRTNAEDHEEERRQKKRVKKKFVPVSNIDAVMRKDKSLKEEAT